MIRTLIVDDYRFFRESFKTRLLEHFPSMMIHEAINGKEAIEKITRVRPHLLFTDICLPGFNGLQLAQKIKKDFPYMKIAILTAYDFPEYRQAAKENGADRFFVKDLLDWREVGEFIQSIPRYDSGPQVLEIGGRIRNG